MALHRLLGVAHPSCSISIALLPSGGGQTRFSAASALLQSYCGYGANVSIIRKKQVNLHGESSHIHLCEAQNVVVVVKAEAGLDDVGQGTAEIEEDLPLPQWIAKTPRMMAKELASSSSSDGTRGPAVGSAAAKLEVSELKALGSTIWGDRQVSSANSMIFGTSMAQGSDSRKDGVA
ncbi:hypothetical protein BDR07DRAFT_1375646 [Suillus spraguei]|nr:hypothetical protein BDR07DRAFT_1375646 [Suillus spraguei]